MVQLRLLLEPAESFFVIDIPQQVALRRLRGAHVAQFFCTHGSLRIDEIRLMANGCGHRGPDDAARRILHDVVQPMDRDCLAPVEYLLVGLTVIVM